MYHKKKTSLIQIRERSVAKFINLLEPAYTFNNDIKSDKQTIQKKPPANQANLGILGNANTPGPQAGQPEINATLLLVTIVRMSVN